MPGRLAGLPGFCRSAPKGNSDAMQRPPSTMTAQDLRDWRERHGHSLASGAEALGITRAMFARYIREADPAPIPRTVALLAVALDTIAALSRRPGRR